jgi:hypothetical protein
MLPESPIGMHLSMIDRIGLRRFAPRQARVRRLRKDGRKVAKMVVKFRCVSVSVSSGLSSQTSDRRF